MEELAAAPQQWTIILALTALCLSLVVLGQLLASHAAAYLAAPREAALLLDALDASIEENESYDRDLTKVPRLEDKIRLVRLLRDIQRAGDDLREALCALFVTSGFDGDENDELASFNTTTTLKASARVLWAVTRRDLEERNRRLDMLRMRFLVVYLGIVAERAPPAVEKQSSPKEKERRQERESEKLGTAAVAASKIPPAPTMAPTPAMLLSRALNEEIKRKPPLRRLTTQAIGHSSNARPSHRTGWAGVVEELQRSPKLQARHAFIERSIEQELALSKLP
ncbi:hypothetical protein D7B24_009585 [Verticillium nonalfalfae]|uniref:Uncharacterized protein n=1 Tax=Verticillium nonalfalfae TaxID=1051616 RepID=A0A3M9Y2Z7_9PEZI|nr:uncharacterized protein D7B24_009585 [Verticillium nonalfalfae]RNJ54631.1 hypothetical protein D7B24_009585 [Verticillium nonalfalfae]